MSQQMRVWLSGNKDLRWLGRVFHREDPRPVRTGEGMILSKRCDQAILAIDVSRVEVIEAVIRGRETSVL